MKVKKAHQPKTEIRDEHELLIQDDFQWLADLRDVLSPYWASSVVDKGALPPILSIQGMRGKGRSAS